MSRTEVFLNIDGERILPTLQDAIASLDGAQGERVLDFSSVCRLDSGDLRALEKLAQVAEDRSMKIVLRGVNVDIYKVLKLIRLANRFSFAN